MIENIKKYLETKGDINLKDCEEVLGTQGKVSLFANFWEKFGKDLELVEAAFLLDFCTTQKFTPEELRFYRLGLMSISEFFKNCEVEFQNAKDNNKKI